MATAVSIIKQIDQLIKLHKSLLKLSNKKTEVITKNNMDAFNKLLNEEQMYIKAINQIEKQRQEEVEVLLGKTSSTQSYTLVDVIQSVQGEEKEHLTKQREELIQLTNELKSSNQLNQQLILNSLQYINLSLNMLRPQDSVYNYDKPTQAKQQPMKNSMFNSRA